MNISDLQSVVLGLLFALIANFADGMLNLLSLPESSNQVCLLINLALGVSRSLLRFSASMLAISIF
jgi:uncharacterized membrane protein